MNALKYCTSASSQIKSASVAAFSQLFKSDTFTFSGGALSRLTRRHKARLILSYSFTCALLSDGAAIGLPLWPLSYYKTEVAGCHLCAIAHRLNQVCLSHLVGCTVIHVHTCTFRSLSYIRSVYKTLHPTRSETETGLWRDGF